jgi:hypothetical protein
MSPLLDFQARRGSAYWLPAPLEVGTLALKALAVGAEFTAEGAFDDMVFGFV